MSHQTHRHSLSFWLPAVHGGEDAVTHDLNVSARWCKVCISIQTLRWCVFMLWGFSSWECARNLSGRRSSICGRLGGITTTPWRGGILTHISPALHVWSAWPPQPHLALASESALVDTHPTIGSYHPLILYREGFCYYLWSPQLGMRKCCAYSTNQHWTTFA